MSRRSLEGKRPPKGRLQCNAVLRGETARHSILALRCRFSVGTLNTARKRTGDGTNPQWPRQNAKVHTMRRQGGMLTDAEKGNRLWICCRKLTLCMYCHGDYYSIAADTWGVFKHGLLMG